MLKDPSTYNDRKAQAASQRPCAGGEAAALGRGDVGQTPPRRAVFDDHRPADRRTHQSRWGCRGDAVHRACSAASPPSSPSTSSTSSASPADEETPATEPVSHAPFPDGCPPELREALQVFAKALASWCASRASSRLPYRVGQPSLGQHPVPRQASSSSFLPRRFQRRQGQDPFGRPTHPLVLATTRHRPVVELLHPRARDPQPHPLASP